MTVVKSAEPFMRALIPNLCPRHKFGRDVGFLDTGKCWKKTWHGEDMRHCKSVRKRHQWEKMTAEGAKQPITAVALIAKRLAFITEAAATYNYKNRQHNILSFPKIGPVTRNDTNHQKLAQSRSK